jgi:hypothetical protein
MQHSGSQYALKLLKQRDATQWFTKRFKGTETEIQHTKRVKVTKVIKNIGLFARLTNIIDEILYFRVFGIFV